MGQIPLYPLRFAPIYQYRLWGGRRLGVILSEPPPGSDPIGEAWILSDREDHSSLVANGYLKGRTISEVMKLFPEQMMGKLTSRFDRFPLLLKFLDAREMLSVQVHPSDAQPDLIPSGETSKTEAWVVIEADEGSKIYAGLTRGTTAGDLKQSLASSTVEDHLAGIVPKPGDAVFIPAGTVHTLGGGVVVFEVQQNSDVTFRLYDWGHVDAKTGQPRPLQVDDAIRCIDFSESTGGLVRPDVESTTPVMREKLFDCRAFRVERFHGQAPFPVGAGGEPRVLVCIDGSGNVEYNQMPHAIARGDVWLLPAEVGACVFLPSGEMTLLEIAIPE
jgi:mannose-6-phosphate isomerase